MARPHWLFAYIINVLWWNSIRSPGDEDVQHALTWIKLDIGKQKNIQECSHIAREMIGLSNSVVVALTLHPGHGCIWNELKVYLYMILTIKMKLKPQLWYITCKQHKACFENLTKSSIEPNHHIHKTCKIASGIKIFLTTVKR